MRPLVLIVLLGVVLLVGVGVVLLGAFPPQPTPQSITRTLPNDRFGTH